MNNSSWRLAHADCRNEDASCSLRVTGADDASARLVTARTVSAMLTADVRDRAPRSLLLPSSDGLSATRSCIDQCRPSPWAAGALLPLVSAAKERP
jgi:hypothetical protein